MKKRGQAIILVLITCLFLFPFISGCVGERGHIGAQGPAGPNGTPGGGGSGLMNQTPNMTPNMTAGPQGIQGLQGIQGDIGPTGATGSAGATGATGAQGIPGPDNDAWYLWVNGTRAMTGIFNAGGFNLSNLLNPVAAQDAVTLTYLLNAIAGIGSTDTSDQHILSNKTAIETDIQNNSSATLLTADQHIATNVTTLIWNTSVTNQTLYQIILNNASLSSSINDSYAYLLGRSGGQILNGGVNQNENLTLNGTINGIGNVLINPNGGNVSIGTNNPSAILDIVGQNIDKLIRLTDYTNSGSAYFEFRRAMGNITTPLIITNNHVMGGFIFSGYDGAKFWNGAGITASTDDTPSLNNMPGRLDFWTVPVGSTTWVSRMNISSKGDINFGNVIINNSKLGIGEFPNQALDVVGSINITSNTGKLYLSSGSYGGTGQIFGDSGGDLNIKATNDWIYIDSAYGTDFRIAGTSKMRLDSNGNLGIAKTSPNARLDVNGNISLNRIVAYTDSVNKSYAGTHGAATAITNGATISHLLDATPLGCQIQPTVANTTMSVTAMSSTTITVSSWQTNATLPAGLAGISQTVYWECWQQ